VEPTGIEPVTSCLQSDTANRGNRLVSGVLCDLGPSRRGTDAVGFGAIGLALGSEAEAAAQMPSLAHADGSPASTLETDGATRA
jgi:hypothetical protein